MEQVLLITGSSGIAAAAARLASSRGYGIFLVGSDRAQCEALANELPKSAYFVTPVEDETGVKKAFDHCVAHLGGVTAVFNVAGISGRSLGDGPLHECSTSAWNTLINIHASGTFFVCREAVRRWMANGTKGVILNTSSVLARYPERNFFATNAYPASKGAIESMTLAAASYYAPYQIRLNVLAPGLVRTPMSARAQTNPQITEFIKNKQPLTGDLVEPEALARIACFLLSDESSPMTGEIIRADGGWAVTG